jgi:hypothetical protein
MAVVVVLSTTFSQEWFSMSKAHQIQYLCGAIRFVNKHPAHNPSF